MHYMPPPMPPWPGTPPWQGPQQAKASDPPPAQHAGIHMWFTPEFFNQMARAVASGQQGQAPAGAGGQGLTQGQTQQAQAQQQQAQLQAQQQQAQAQAQAQAQQQQAQSQGQPQQEGRVQQAPGVAPVLAVVPPWTPIGTRQRSYWNRGV